MRTHEELVVVGREIVQAAPQLVIDVDVEADGVPGMGSLLSIGAVTPWDEKFYAELKPRSAEWIPSNRAFCEAHGLERDRLLAEGRDPNQVMRQFARWAVNLTQTHHKESPVLVAFNASFDGPWIDLELKRAGIMQNPFGVTAFCTESLGLALSSTYDWSKTSKRHLPPQVVPPGGLTHNALEDAEYQQKMHFAVAAWLGFSPAS